METEKFVSGYCRQLDGSRMVEVVLEGGLLLRQLRLPEQLHHR